MSATSGGNPLTIKNVRPHDMHKENVVPTPRIYSEILRANYNINDE